MIGTPRRAAVSALLLLLAGGCADRGLASRPPASTGTGTWLAVVAAGVLATIVLAALIVPATRPGGAGFAARFLALQAAAAAVATAIIVGAAVRSGQLVNRPADAEQAASLLRLTGLDGGDTGFFPIVAVVAAILGLLLVIVLALAARFAADTDPLERGLASAVLAIEILAACGAAVFVVVAGDPRLPLALGATCLPALVVALIRCWPDPPAADPDLGYNGGHG